MLCITKHAKSIFAYILLSKFLIPKGSVSVSVLCISYLVVVVAIFMAQEMTLAKHDG